MSKKKSSKESTTDRHRKDREFVAAILSNEDIKESIQALPCEIFKATGIEANGEVGFRYDRAGRPGIVSLDFYPMGFDGWAKDVARAVARAVIAAKIAGQPGADEFLKSDKFQTHADGYANDAEIDKMVGLVFIKGLSGKLSSLLGELELETEVYVRGITFKAVKADADTGIKRLAKEMAEERKRFLERSIANFLSPKWEKMKAHYDEISLEITAAKNVYEGNLTRDWQGMIRQGFPQLNADVIIFLAGDANALATLSDEANEGYSKLDGLSDIALEQAARLCGMKPFALGPRRIRELMDTHDPASPKQTSPKEQKPASRQRKKSKMVSEKIH